MHNVKIDFHTHTCFSPDAFTSIDQISFFLKKNKDFIIAITDHNHIEGAFKAERVWGERIIVGEEIKTFEGEIIGLYLNKFIDPGMSLELTIEAMQRQGGLVMIPHPFKRKGNQDSFVKEETLHRHIKCIDIVEGYNARNRTRDANEKALLLAKNYEKAIGVGSDAHAVYELGRVFVPVSKYEGKENVLAELRNSQPTCKPIHWSHRILTKIQRELKKRVNGHHTAS